jgi:ABC-type transporter Mla subunit MlaD
MVMRARKETLSAAVTNLEQALRGAAPWSRAWALLVEQALTSVEQAVRRQDTFLAATDGNVVDVESGLANSPGMERRLAHLHEELAGFLGEVDTLRKRVQRVLEGGAAEVPPSPFDNFHRRAEALLDALQGYEQEEAQLIQESVNTDIGGGD